MHASLSFLYGNKQLRENTFSHKHLTSFRLKLLHRNLENQSCFMNSFTTAILLRNPCLDRLITFVLWVRTIELSKHGFFLFTKICFKKRIGFK